MYPPTHSHSNHGHSEPHEEGQHYERRESALKKGDKKLSVE
jgi:hypothetical protein